VRMVLIEIMKHVRNNLSLESAAREVIAASTAFQPNETSAMALLVMALLAAIATANVTSRPVHLLLTRGFPRFKSGIGSLLNCACQV
jgi:hypothetical protein